MSYKDDIVHISYLTLDDVIQISKDNVPNYLQNRPWTCNGLNHGTAVLSTEEQLCCYIAAYGEMHKQKLDKALESFPFKNLDSDFEIMDWGCGQGLATVHIISQLRSKNLLGKLKKVTLVEPSKLAIKRAEFNVNKAVDNGVEVLSIQKYLPSVSGVTSTISSIHIAEPICIHLFSNILDIPEIDLKKLANIIACSGHQHYFICVGPVNYGNQRIEAFSRYFSFDNANLFANVFIPQYRQLNNGKWFGCIAKGFKVIRTEGKPFLIPLSFYPPKEFIAAYQLDAIRAKQINVENLIAFDVLAPFDIGASIYTDVDPILAVINNIITRGTPTKASPFIEEQFSNIIKATSIQERYGAIDYVATDEKFISKYEEALKLIPIGVARIQKVIIEAVMTGRLSLDKEQLDVVVKEDIIPCSALAFADLAMMYDHLCALSRDYDKRKFPKINLHIISPQNEKSLFHLGSATYSSTKKLDREKEYDLVIDINFSDRPDAENVQFSEFKVRNECYFNIRSCIQSAHRQIYTSDRIVYKPLTKLNQSGGYDNIEENVEHLNYFLNLIFRKKAFRPGQLPILTRALQNKGVIGLLPTGGGKSLTYQLAAMLQPGITVVIDPLKSLMEDQYDGLIAAGIDACTFINSELDPEIRTQHEDMMESSQVLIAFMSPERLCIYPFRERLSNMHDLGVYFSYGVIDEVHCVSEWGQDFRPSYLHLGRNLYQYVRAKEGRISLFGLTATASFDVLSDVERELSGYGAFTLDSETIVRYENSNRLELQYKIERVEIEYEPDNKFDDHGLLNNYPTPVKLGDKWSAYKQKSSFLKNLLGKIPHYLDELLEEDSLNEIVSRFKDREELSSIDPSKLIVNVESDYLSMRDDYKFSGIVFCSHVNSTGISVNVNSKELSNLCEVGSFSGSDQTGETDNKSMENMRKFRENKLPLMVATKAFGMGIDKPNVRFTVNMNYSSSLESFIQEAGRAGRDGHMALSLILLSDYKLCRIKHTCRICDVKGIIPTIAGRWFKEDDFNLIIRDFNLNISNSDIDICDPLNDLVRLRCNTDNPKIDKNGQPILASTGGAKKAYWRCNQCSKSRDCNLRHVSKDLQWKWFYLPDLQQKLRENRIRLTSNDYEYSGPDYGTIMFFFDNNFKGEIEEKQKMHELLSVTEIKYFKGNDSQYKPEKTKVGHGFMEALLNSKIGEELIVLISYTNETLQDVAKAIYRMCCIGVIDDFTQKFPNSFNGEPGIFRIVATRKKGGAYYQRLKEFLMRYYSEERAENEVERASVRKGNNEIHKCLGYLTEFVYDKVVMKRKRAIDDMRNFCLTGIDDTKDWKEINEDLKDEIFFYFNSKFARAGYRTENDEPFSLYDDVVEEKKRDFDTLFKYMRVIDNDVIGASGSPKDNIKHLRGAVRLIRRSETDTNPVLSLLNVFCLLILKRPEYETLSRELEDSFIEGYLTFLEQTPDKEVFYSNIKRFFKELNIKGRNIAGHNEKDLLRSLQMSSEVLVNDQWLNNFRQNYTL